MRHPWDEFSGPQRATLEQTSEGKPISTEQAMEFAELRPSQILALSMVADRLRADQCGDEVSYVVNRNVNFTNVCIKSCRFCAFSRDHRDQEGYYLDEGQILARIDQAKGFGATEVCIQAGLPPKMEGDLYIRLTRAVKRDFPDMHLHAFSPEEVLYGAVRSKCSTLEYLQELKAAGLDTLPGTSAEVLDQELRDALAPGRITVEQWKQVIREAHRVGLRTTSTMMFGHIEEPRHWVEHMAQLLEIQRETGGFTEFVPLGFVHQEAPLSFMQEMKGRTLGPSGLTVLHVHALARLMLGHEFRNIQASWVKEGEKLANILLAAGCNDLGGTLMNESISTAAGANHGQLLSPKRLRHIVRSAGRRPIQRNTVYDTLKVFDGEQDSGDALDGVENSDSVFGSYHRLTEAKEHRFVHPNAVRSG